MRECIVADALFSHLIDCHAVQYVHLDGSRDETFPRRCILSDATRPGTPPWHEAVVFMPNGVGRGEEPGHHLRTESGCTGGQTDAGLDALKTHAANAGGAHEHSACTRG